MIALLVSFVIQSEKLTFSVLTTIVNIYFGELRLVHDIHLTMIKCSRLHDFMLIRGNGIGNDKGLLIKCNCIYLSQLSFF